MAITYSAGLSDSGLLIEIDVRDDGVLTSYVQIHRDAWPDVLKSIEAAMLTELVGAQINVLTVAQAKRPKTDTPSTRSHARERWDGGREELMSHDTPEDDLRREQFRSAQLEAEIDQVSVDRDHWQRMATQYQIERDGLRRTLSDILGMDRQHSAQGEREDG